MSPSSDKNEERIMGNGVIITPPHDFKQPSIWCNRVQKVTNYAFGVLTHGKKSIPNVMKILTEIVSVLKFTPTDNKGYISFGLGCFESGLVMLVMRMRRG
jgi:hypothetical protein